MSHEYYIYMLTNKYRNVLYIGVTNDLIRRVYEHKNKLTRGFTQRYNVDCLVYYEVYDDIAAAIEREKQIKGWTREKKNKLVNTFNLQWADLYNEIC